MTTHNTDQTKPEVELNEMTKKLFVEPEISGPIDVLESTAFFQVITGGTDVPPDLTP